MDDAGVGTLDQRKMLTMAAKSHTVTILAAAKAQQSTNNHKSKIAAAEADIAAGDALRDAGDYPNAVGMYLLAARGVQSIAN